jgi:hypothetical protein
VFLKPISRYAHSSESFSYILLLDDQMTKSKSSGPVPENGTFHELAEHLRGLYCGKISEPELHEATRNLIGFCKILIEIQRELAYNTDYE